MRLNALVSLKPSVMPMPLPQNQDPVKTLPQALRRLLRPRREKFAHGNCLLHWTMRPSQIFWTSFWAKLTACVYARPFGKEIARIIGVIYTTVPPRPGEGPTANTPQTLLNRA
jgi:hypothetical protein